MSKYTYTFGPRFRCFQDFTTGDLFHICADLSVAFGTEIIPERITEGGLLFKKYSHHFYKCIRFHSQNGAWPWITDDWIEIAKQNPNMIIWKKIDNYFVIGTALNALHGAPLWTINELNIIINTFAKYGIYVIEESKPIERDLTHEYSIGTS